MQQNFAACLSNARGHCGRLSTVVRIGSCGQGCVGTDTHHRVSGYRACIRGVLHQERCAKVATAPACGAFAAAAPAADTNH